jgi:hypothetical protein
VVCNVALVSVTATEEERAFRTAVTQLLRLTERYDTQDTWEAFLRPLKRERFLMSATPCPRSRSDPEAASSTYNILRTFLDGRAGSDPEDLLGCAEDCVISFESLIVVGRSSLLERLAQSRLSREHGNEAVIVLDGTLAQDTRDQFDQIDELRGLPAMGAAALRQPATYDRLYVFGSSTWYSMRELEFIFAAPRASQMEIMGHPWLIREPALQRPFEGGIPATRRAQSTPVTRPQAADEYLPSLDIDSVVRESTGIDETTVEARLVVLAGNQCALLDIGSKHLILSPDAVSAKAPNQKASDQDPTMWVADQDLIDGMYILLRTQGGGDYIEPMADNILGADQHRVRAHQKDWKRALQSKVRVLGKSRVRSEIIRRSGREFVKVTLDNWLSPRHIRPGNETHFSAVLSLTGLEDIKSEMFESARLISGAHKRAGMQIRQLLLEEVRNADLRELQANGLLEFHLGEAESSAPSLTAYRIEVVGEQTRSVSYSDIGTPFPMKSHHWQ